MLLPMFLVVAAQIEIGPQDDLFGALQALQPGDELIVRAGNHPVPGYVNLVLAGTADAPIVIRAADGEAAVIEGIPEQNALNIEGSYFTLRGLEIAGGSHGVRLGSVAHATLEDLHIHHTGDVGVSCNREGNACEDLTIRRVHIHDTGVGGGPGECMYLGCNDGSCKMWDSRVEYNWCHDTLAGSQGDGIEVKTGSYNTIVRHNVIHDVKYPGITMYGTQGMAPNLVEGNAVWNVEDNGIQTVGDVTVRNNLVFNTGASGIASKASQGEVVADLTIVHNTVIGAGDACLRGNDFPGGGAITIANNALYCEGGTAIKLASGAGQAVLAGNAVLGNVEGAPGGTFDGGGLAAAFTDASGLQVYPAPGSPLIDAGDPQYAAADDFNCTARAGTPEVGAYDVSAAQNPGWTVAPGFKECAGGDSDSDSDGETGAETGETGETTGSTDDTGAGEDNYSEPTTLPPDPPTTTDDPNPTAGTDGTGATAGTDTATAGATEGAPLDDGAGCGCRGTDASPLGLLLGLAALRRRRR